MSIRLVVDTSVAFKWFVGYGESGLDEAWELLRAHRDGEVTLIAPSLVLAEIANRLRYSGIRPDDALEFLTDFDQSHVALFNGTYERTKRAVHCAFENRITVYDAMFLALAQEFECTLVTADRKAFGAIPPNVATVRLIL